jgi:hypothetical protein
MRNLLSAKKRSRHGMGEGWANRARGQARWFGATHWRRNAAEVTLKYNLGLGDRRASAAK